MNTRMPFPQSKDKKTGSTGKQSKQKVPSPTGHKEGKLSFSTGFEAGKITQCITDLVTKPNDLNLIPGTHMVEEEDRLPQVGL